MRMEALSRHSLRETVTTGPEALAAAPWHLRSVLAWTECSLLAGWSGISASAKSAESGGDGGEGIKECCSGGRCCSCSCLKAAAACAGCTGTVEDMVKEVAVAGSKSAVHESHFHHDDL